MKKFIIISVSIVLIFITYVMIENSILVVKKYNIVSSKIDKGLDGYKIGLITDFHNSSNFSKIIKKMKTEKPEMIALVGDTINMSGKECENADKLIEGLIDIAPVYLVSGNHEIAPMAQDITARFYKYAQEKGVTIIDNKAVEIEYNHSVFNLIGFGDIIYDDKSLQNPVFYNKLKENLQTLYDEIQDKNRYNILLFHRGNYIDTISEYPFDLVLAGHLHGGQINLPYIRNRLLIDRFGTDKYLAGYYREGNLQGIISRGAIYSLKPPRLFNPPEINIIILKGM